MEDLHPARRSVALSGLAFGLARAVRPAGEAGLDNARRSGRVSCDLFPNERRISRHDRPGQSETGQIRVRNAQRGSG